MASPCNIYSALSARAYAQHFWPAVGFQDPAARSLATLLGIGEPVNQDLVWGRSCLLRSQWFDEQCRQFFQRYPQAMCIDLGAGLNTRFHRLSKSADWPRFSWVDVDLPEVIAIKAQAIPKIDNYHLQPANIAKDDWLASSGWHPRTPLIITLESVLLNMKLTDACNIFSTIVRHCTAASTIEIVFDYPMGKTRWYHALNLSAGVRCLRDHLAELGLSLKRSELNRASVNFVKENFFVYGFAPAK